MLSSDAGMSAYTAMQGTVKASLGELDPALAVPYNFTKPPVAPGPLQALSPFSALEREVCSSYVSSLYVQLMCS